ncbi:hypothetical protein ACK1H6_004394, partial [Salmonella enterica]
RLSMMLAYRLCIRGFRQEINKDTARRIQERVSQSHDDSLFSHRVNDKKRLQGKPQRWLC